MENTDRRFEYMERYNSGDLKRRRTAIVRVRMLIGDCNVGSNWCWVVLKRGGMGVGVQ